MKKSWSTLKKIIRDSYPEKDLYLALIDEQGVIHTANTNMLRHLDIANPREKVCNFFDYVHPVNREELRHLLIHNQPSADTFELELYIRNGEYHPMKWRFTQLIDPRTNGITFFCLGFELLDDQRLQRFNNLARNHFSLIVEGLSGILFQDIRGGIVGANQKLANMFATNLERVYEIKDLKDTWGKYFKVFTEDGEPIEYENSPFRQVISTKKPQQKILVITFNENRKHWVLVNSQLLAEGECPESMVVVSTIVDLTEERRSVQELRDKEHSMKAFLQESPNLAWIVDDEETLLFANNAFLSYFSLPAKCIGEKVTSLIPPSISQTVYAQHLEVLDSGKPRQTIHHFKKANGQDEVTSINIFPIETSSGKRILGGLSTSIQDNAKLEKELVKAQERLWTLNRATSDAIWEWDMQSGQIYRNETLMQMIGYQADNSRGLSWWLRRIHPEDRNRAADKVKDATDSHLPSWQDSYRFKCADGTYKFVQDRGFVVYENGLPIKMIGSLQDISAIKELESQLDDERLQKQKIISETVIQVAENERTKIGHELHDNVNQILSTAKLFVDMLEVKDADQQILKDKSNDYLTLAIEEIRKLSRDLVAPQLKEEKLSNSIRLLVQDIEMAHDMEILFDHNAESEFLSEGKKVTLFRIVQEQLKNIIKHSGASRTQISLQGEDGMVRLRISDNGKGFNPHQTYRGIGLNNIYERTKFYNGNVEIVAAPGKGCTITVTIPAE